MALERKASSARKQGGVLQNFPENRERMEYEKKKKEDCVAYSTNEEVKWTGCYHTGSDMMCVMKRWENGDSWQEELW